MARIAKLDSNNNTIISCEECGISTRHDPGANLICQHGEYSFDWAGGNGDNYIFMKIKRVAVRKFHQMKADVEPVYWEVTDE